MNWQPTASIETLRERAKLLQQIRAFFAEREVLEVDTPALSHATVTDVHLFSFDTQFFEPGANTSNTLYLQTSPEYAMKRLLAAGSGPIFQISKSFRNEEAGRHHNPEFTMLEWYRPGFDHLDLMEEVSNLLSTALQCADAEKVTYQSAFSRYLGCDPLEASLTELKAVCNEHGYEAIAKHEDNKDTLLQLLFSQIVEPNIGLQRPCIVFDFPASQAALARISQTDNRVAERFEAYFKGIELANGFHELADANEQLARFEADNRKRKAMNLPIKPIDHHLIAALDAGFPNCAGVALGVDRLLMLQQNKASIEEVIAFPVSRA